MKKIRPFILAFTVILAGVLAFGIWTLPKPQKADAEGYSAARVAKDIKVIAKNHHSVAQPEERAEVRDYLVHRLKEEGADTVRLYRYDSLSGPENKHVRYDFDAVNILAEFDPENKTEDTPYLMLVAHYDSRFSQPMPKNDTVWSYGAADDGYGLAAILETMNVLGKDRSDWKQGVKVLYTDAEEVGRMGMIEALKNNKEIFDNVGMVINIEARGPWGPVLLFETSPGNAKLMELYAEAARYPYTYSLTSVVYRLMPNFTDFNEVKDLIPGMNFSTVVDINHYHTDKDSYGNICVKSIQHYGSQIVPVVEKYLTDSRYSDKDYLKGKSDRVSFTTPVLGLWNFSKPVYVAFTLLICLVFLCLFALEGVRGKLKSMKVFKTSGLILGLALAMLVLGEVIAKVCASIAGAKFSLFGTVQGVQFDNIAMAVSMVLMIAVTVFVYCVGRRRAVRSASSSMRASAGATAAKHYTDNVLYAGLSLMFFFSFVLVLAISENLMFLMPLLFAVGAILLNRFAKFKVWYIIAIACILLHVFSFLYALAMALTIGAFGVVFMLAFMDMMIVIPLADLYLSEK